MDLGILIAEKLQVKRYNEDFNIFDRNEADFIIYRTLASVNSVILLEYNPGAINPLLFLGIIAIVGFAVTMAVFNVIRNIRMKKGRV